MRSLFSLDTAPAIRTIACVASSILTLTGCYVEVSHEHEAPFDTEVHYDTDIRDFDTQFLVDAAIVPLALSAESAYMVMDPDAYTTPRARNLNRALIIETTYSYLFDDWDCEYGGFTQNEAEASTTSYDDGYTFVDLTLNAKAFDCEVRSNGQLHRVNSDIDYDVTGWYDDWENELSSIDARTTGNAQIQFNGQSIEHSNISMRTNARSATEITLSGDTNVRLDDGWDVEFATLSTRSSVQFYIGATHPHSGEVRLNDGGVTVTLTFEQTGVWREDSNGYGTFWTWSELGFL